MNAVISMPEHYSIKKIDSVEALRAVFPSAAEVNDMNFVLFSTSGVHGTYTTLDEIQDTADKYGWDQPDDLEDITGADDFAGYKVTILVVHPRIVCLRYGDIRVTNQSDLDYLKEIRDASSAVLRAIHD